MKNQKLINEIENQLSKHNTAIIFDWVMIVLGTLALIPIFIIGIIFLILGIVLYSKHHKKREALKIQLIEAGGEL